MGYPKINGVLLPCLGLFFMLGCGRSSTVQQKCEVDADCPTGQGCNEYDVCVALPIAQVERPTDKKDGGTASSVKEVSDAGSWGEPEDAGARIAATDAGVFQAVLDAGGATAASDAGIPGAGSPDAGPECLPCEDGFVMGDACNCENVDECEEEEDNCAPEAVCKDTPGSFECDCGEGYEGNGTVCTDTDGCASDPCYAGQRLHRRCCAGRRLHVRGLSGGAGGDGEVCEDTDGCASDPCYAGVACTDVAAPGEGYTCGACPAGLSGDGEICEDTDGCASDPCYAGVTCTDVAAPGEGYTCGACPAGLSGDGENLRRHRRLRFRPLLRRGDLHRRCCAGRGLHVRGLSGGA